MKWTALILILLVSGCSTTLKIGGGGVYCEDNAGIYLPHTVK